MQILKKDELVQFQVQHFLFKCNIQNMAEHPNSELLKFTGELADKDWKQSSKKWENGTNFKSQLTSFAQSESANGEQQNQSSWKHLLSDSMLGIWKYQLN